MDGVITRKIEPAFTDTRGDISDIVEEPVGHVGHITFTKGAVRASHYHKQSTQYTFTLYGKLELLVFPKDKPGEREVHILEAGDFASIEPGIVHTYRALEPSAIIDMTTLSRLDNGYEEDTVRVPSA